MGRRGETRRPLKVVPFSLLRYTTACVMRVEGPFKGVIPNHTDSGSHSQEKRKLFDIFYSSVITLDWYLVTASVMNLLVKPNVFWDSTDKYSLRALNWGIQNFPSFISFKSCFKVNSFWGGPSFEQVGQGPRCEVVTYPHLEPLFTHLYISSHVNIPGTRRVPISPYIDMSVYLHPNIATYPQCTMHERA